MVSKQTSLHKARKKQHLAIHHFLGLLSCVVRMFLRTFTDVNTLPNRRLWRGKARRLQLHSRGCNETILLYNAQTDLS